MERVVDVGEGVHQVLDLGAVAAGQIHPVGVGGQSGVCGGHRQGRGALCLVGGQPLGGVQHGGHPVTVIGDVLTGRESEVRQDHFLKAQTGQF